MIKKNQEYVKQWWQILFTRSLTRETRTQSSTRSSIKEILDTDPVEIGTTYKTLIAILEK